MKVTAFVGSPRKRGNTDILADVFLEGAASAGAEVQKFFLDDCAINQCRGCFRNCMTKPGYRCAAHRDDMDRLLDELVSSGISMFASPLYCSGCTAIMARFLERCLPLWEVELAGEPGTVDAFRFINNPAKGKKAVLAMVQDLKNPVAAELALKAFESNLAKTFQMDVIETLHVTDVRDIGDIAQKTAALEKVFATGKRLAEGS
jgi:multimeric flavodoxin WrbA